MYGHRFDQLGSTDTEWTDYDVGRLATIDGGMVHF
jgi:hypothetical protein